MLWAGMGVRTTAPDRERAAAQYRAVAGVYDERASLRLSRGAQRRAVERLELLPGAQVLDVACGTGLNFAAIEAAIGPQGSLVGIDLSADMLVRARRRVHANGWRNVELVACAAEDLSPTGAFDAALLSFAHDVLRSTAALERVLACLREGARVAAAGVMYPSGARAAARPLVRRVARPYVTTFEGFERPWSHLEALIGAPLRVERLQLGVLYVVSGRVGRPA
jgi:ubiquinone/menaquinone biosynthesis C-methylase UbiE